MFGQNLVPNRVRPIRVCRPRHTETCKRLRPIKRHGWLSALTRLVKSFFCGVHTKNSTTVPISSAAALHTSHSESCSWSLLLLWEVLTSR